MQIHPPFAISKRSSFLIGTVLSLISINSTAQDSIQGKNDFKDTGRIWGYVFGDYAYKLHADAEKRGNIQYSRLPQNYNSFNIRRVYIGYDYQFSPNISSQFVLAHESGSEANEGNRDELTNKHRGVYIKTMNIRFKNVIPHATIVAGQQARPTPSFSTSGDPIWGYRSIEKSITDLRGISSTNDLGIGIIGKIGKNENVGYDLMVGNNNKAKLENNNFKKLYTSLYGYFLNKKLLIHGNYENGTATTEPVRKNLSTIKGLIAYKSKQTTVAVEVFQQWQTNNSAFLRGFDTAYANGKSSGISFYVTQKLKKDQLKSFARFDLYDPDTQYNSDNHYIGFYNIHTECFAVIGLDWIPYKNVHIMPNFWCDQFKSKFTSTSVKQKNDYDLAARITLYFLFDR